MNKTVTGEENLYFEIESAREETDTRIYDDVLSECATTATKQTSLEKHSSQEAEKKRSASAEHHNGCQCNTVSLRRMLFLMSIVAAVALLTAVASLILALTAMSSKAQESGSTSTMKSEDDDRIEKVSENITKLDKKMEERIQQLEKRIPDERLVNNVSKMVGPIGPPGFNGSQGAAGPRGATGPPGPKGVGNFSTCQYTIVKDTFAPGTPSALASKTEPTGKIILGAACSTNYAAEYNLKSQQRPGHNGRWSYACECRGTSTLFTPLRGDKHCYLHYWECPLTT